MFYYFTSVFTLRCVNSYVHIYMYKGVETQQWQWIIREDSLMLPQDIRFKERGVFVIIIETSCFLFENFVQNRAYREVACPQSIVLIERVILFFSRAPDIMTPIPVGHPAFINFTGKVNLVDLKMEFGKFL